MCPPGRLPVNPTPLHAHNPGPYTGDGNWTWLLGGRVPTLVDAGSGVARHLDDVEEALGGARLAQVLVTHAHQDHASGAPAIAQRFPGARFLKFPWPERDAAWPVPWEPLADGQVVEAGDTSLVTVHTPGHAPDHVAFWHEESRSLFGGDLAIKGNTVWIPARLSGDLTQYLASLERVLALRPARVLPAHGGVIDDPEPLLRNYIAHRHERERQIVAALHAGDTTPDAIVGRLYRGLRDAMIPLARESVVAHLNKLERDGRARRVDDAWIII